MKKLVILALLGFFLSKCKPCKFYKNIRAGGTEGYVTLVYQNYQNCQRQDTCSKIWVYLLSETLELKDSICVKNAQNHSLYSTDCVVTLSLRGFDAGEQAPVVIHIQGTSVWDTIFSADVEDPCTSSEPNAVSVNINGKWYDGTVIYR